MQEVVENVLVVNGIRHHFKVTLSTNKEKNYIIQFIRNEKIIDAIECMKLHKAKKIFKNFSKQIPKNV